MPSSSIFLQEQPMHGTKNSYFLKLLISVFGFGLIIFALGGLGKPEGVSAAPSPIHPKAQSTGQAPDNESCLTCHGKPDLTKTLPSGEILSLTIDASHFAKSAHKDIACTDCHSNISSFPHPDLKVQTLRDFSLKMYTICQK
jgi:hypothetical protein